MSEATGWYTAPSDIVIGAIGGLDTDSHGNVIVFHRGSHTWDADSFDDDNVYMHEKEGDNYLYWRYFTLFLPLLIHSVNLTLFYVLGYYIFSA